MSAGVRSWEVVSHCRTPELGARIEWYDREVYAQRFKVELLIGEERRLCPLEWLDQFCMRNFTNAAEFDDTLPISEGEVEASFRVTPEHFAESFGAWLTQRGKGGGQPVKAEVHAILRQTIYTS
jgi:hypothetical protein